MSDTENILNAAQTILSGVMELGAQKENAYWERNQLVNAFAKMAYNAGWLVWIGQHVDDPEGPVWDAEWRNIVFIQTPNGQVSWHFQDKEMVMFDWILQREAPMLWDNHNTKEKYARLAALDLKS